MQTPFRRFPSRFWVPRFPGNHHLETSGAFTTERQGLLGTPQGSPAEDTADTRDVTLFLILFIWPFSREGPADANRCKAPVHGPTALEEVLSRQPVCVPRLPSAAWAQLHRARERVAAGKPGERGCMEGLGPESTEPLTCHVRTRLVVEPISGPPGGTGAAGREGDASLRSTGHAAGDVSPDPGSEDICPLLCTAGLCKLGRSRHLPHATRVTFGVPLAARKPSLGPLV